jgi:hypothetical protein
METIQIYELEEWLTDKETSVVLYGDPTSGPLYINYLLIKKVINENPGISFAVVSEPLTFAMEIYYGVDLMETIQLPLKDYDTLNEIIHRYSVN